jgi:hypothetical protein
MSPSKTPRQADSVGPSFKTAMRVFTTIFLAETLRANIECVEETTGLDQNLPGAVEFKRTLADYIAILEQRRLFSFDDHDRK